MRILLVERSIYPRTLEQRNPIFDVFRKPISPPRRATGIVLVLHSPD